MRARGRPTVGALLASCWWIPRPAVVPLRTVSFPGAGPSRGDLLVFLPGRGDRAEDFEGRGLLEAARASGLDMEALCVDAHLAYYRKGAIADRLWADVVVPAHARGHDRLWFVGISLGGLGALSLARAHPEAVAGVLAVAPYLGSPQEVAAREGGGGARSRPGGPAEDFASLWAWLRGYASGAPGRPPLWLAYGESDRYAYGDRRLAALLPPARVLCRPGGHEWRTWGRLWSEFLARGAFGRLPGAAGAR